MLGSAYYIIGAIALVVLQPSAALNATTANAVCNLLEDGLMIFSGVDCGQYYSCSNGTATLSSCGSGFYFSKDNQGCLPSSSVTCTLGDGDPCQNVANGVFVAVPNSCSGFYYCSNGIGTLGSCPEGLNFDATDQSCNYTTDYGCTTTNGGGTSDSINLCAVIPNGNYFASSTSCQAWQECQNGALTVGTCPSPYYFNVDTASCDYQDNVSCRQLTGDTSTGTNPGYLAGTSCSTNGLVVSDNVTCAGYYLCSSNVYSYGTCSSGLYYNPPTKTCVNRLDAVNNCNRCEGTTLEFVNLYQDNCVGYGYCSSGRMASTGLCSNGYFDEVAEACVIESEEPQYPVCNESLSGLPSTTTASTDTTSSDSSSDSSSSDSSTDSTTDASSSSSSESSTVSTTSTTV